MVQVMEIGKFQMVLHHLIRERLMDIMEETS